MLRASTSRLNANAVTLCSKVMRRILRKVAEGAADQLGDVSTLADPSVVDAIVAGWRADPT